MRAIKCDMDINAKHLSLVGALCMSVTKSKHPFKLKLTDEHNLQYAGWMRNAK